MDIFPLEIENIILNYKNDMEVLDLIKYNDNELLFYNSMIKFNYYKVIDTSTIKHFRNLINFYSQFRIKKSFKLTSNKLKIIKYFGYDIKYIQIHPDYNNLRKCIFLKDFNRSIFYNNFIHKVFI